MFVVPSDSRVKFKGHPGLKSGLEDMGVTYYWASNELFVSLVCITCWISGVSDGLHPTNKTKAFMYYVRLVGMLA